MIRKLSRERKIKLERQLGKLLFQRKVTVNMIVKLIRKYIMLNTIKMELNLRRRK